MSNPSFETVDRIQNGHADATRAAARLRLLLLARGADEAARVASTVSGRDGLECEPVSRVSDALRRIRQGRHAAVLVDAGALEAEPLASLERLAEAAGEAPIFLIASRDSDIDPTEAIRHGVQDVLRREHLTIDRLELALACGIERQRRFAALRDLSLTDPLTGLHNRRGFRSLAEASLRWVRRTQHQSLLLFGDVDQLKRINDMWGHAAGDRALLLCAEALTHSLRDSDIVARYGGDEFVALAIDVCEGATEVLIPRIASNLTTLARRARWNYPLSMSVGAATVGHGNLPLDEVLARADRALYSAKRKRVERTGPNATLPLRG